MAKKWQLWLSPRPSRTQTPAGPRILSPHDAAMYEFNYEPNGGLVVTETHYADNPVVRAGKSGPPLHIHLRQTEYFEVVQGVLGAVKNEKEVAWTKDDGLLKITPGTRHRFWPHSSNTDQNLVFKVWAEPQDLDLGFDESYLRAGLGYLRDCQREGMEPSVFQLALLGCSSETVLTPSFWMPIWLLKGVHHALAYWIAKPLLGYEETYPEYAVPEGGRGRGTKKTK
ncbi:hypothetical protein B0T17DRAFT_618402 [Bombardia bombarda]|uniref:Cupin 2 conserved barrel domain-containing protein n=1 Tax=Bombardia bombarda TaxID=252184 RepID=A0AA39WUU8_9PEZI|nr:hypothetical protein B0T17DRAFT_618402 [Bombardia bombarda]